MSKTAPGFPGLSFQRGDRYQVNKQIKSDSNKHYEENWISGEKMVDVGNVLDNIEGSKGTSDGRKKLGWGQHHRPSPQRSRLHRDTCATCRGSRKAGRGGWRGVVAGHEG